jgi:hypothetical protein
MAVVCVITLCMLFNFVGSSALRGRSDVYKKAYDLVKQSQRWLAMSVQDTNPMFAMRHANFAAAYLEAARHLVSDESLNKMTSKNVALLASSISKQQERSVASMGKQCPKALPKGTTMNTWLD